MTFSLMSSVRFGATLRFAPGVARLTLRQFDHRPQ